MCPSWVGGVDGAKGGGGIQINSKFRMTGNQSLREAIAGQKIKGKVSKEGFGDEPCDTEEAANTTEGRTLI